VNLPDSSSIEPRFLDAGEAALVVEFGQVVDPAINDQVLALERALSALALPGIRETVPTFRSLMIHYDPLVIDRATLVDRVRALETQPAPPRAAVRWTVPCCYDPPLGEDLAQIAALAGLTPEQVVALHTGAELRVYMYGFVPGFCYLGLLPELAISRRASVRAPHPPNTVLVADSMCVITTVSMPTGWWLIGRTPERLFAPAREPAFLVGVGDALRFAAVDRASFDALEARAATGEVGAKREKLA
jgi:KipI family sensor histidine kinase inhibitor